MRVLHLLSSTGFHGAENMTAELIRGLSAQGVENYVGAFWNNESSNTEIIRVAGSAARDAVVFTCRGKWDWRTVFSLRAYVQKHRIDIIHSHKYKTNLYAAVASFGLRCLLISTCHNWLLTDAKLRLYAAFDKRVLGVFDMVVGVSQEVVDELRKYIARKKTVKIDNGIDIAKFSAPVSKHEAKAGLGLANRRVVGFVGRLSRNKAVSSLLRAVKSLEDQALRVDALIVGEGEQKDALRNEADSLGIGERVHFLGQRNDTPQLYAAMDIFVLPSLEEAFPMVVLEAMAAGVPVIATRVGDIPYILGDGGVLVDPGAVEQVSAALHRLLVDEAAARQMALTGRLRARECFSSLAMAHRYHELYGETWERRYGAQ
jgi:glycosyltransferase involved in cell wall biosynthesis